MGVNLPVVNLGTHSNGTRYTAKSLSAGNSHTCAILDDDSVKCWGINTYGQLGLGDVQHRGDAVNEMGNNLPKINLGLGKTAKAISAGTNHTCAILNDDTLKCWGYNVDGQLGYGNNTTLFAPSGATVQFAVGRSVRQVSAGIAHTCVILDDNTVYCWGNNGDGQLGMEHADSLDAPNVNAINLGTGRTAVQISSRGNHSCAVLDDGSAKCWGDNFKGQLGQNDEKSGMATIGKYTNQMGDYLTPIELGAGRTAVVIETSNLAEYGSQRFGHTCIILDDASVKCWGTNTFFQLGTGVINTTSIGDAVGEMGALVAIQLGSGLTTVNMSLGAAHTCAVLGGYTIKCWGWGALGQLGNESWINRGSCCMGDSLPAANVNDPLAQTATAVVLLLTPRTATPTATRTLTNDQKTATAASQRTRTAVAGRTNTVIVARTRTAVAGRTNTVIVARTRTAVAGRTNTRTMTRTLIRRRSIIVPITMTLTPAVRPSR
jgi:alpha-tubulin suppressor-like RCC1 family protein